LTAQLWTVLAHLRFSLVTAARAWSAETIAKKLGHQPDLDDGPSLSELRYCAAITRFCRRFRRRG
jgi:hypothetical protein